MSSVPSAFNVYDIVGHWVPGVFVAAIVLPVLPQSTRDAVADMGAGAALFGLAATYAFGFLLSAIGTGLDRLWSKVFGFRGHKLLEVNGDGYAALGKKLEQSGIPRSLIADPRNMFTAAVTFINLSSAGGDRASRFYAASMLSRSLCVALLLGTILYTRLAWQSCELSPFGWAGIACIGCAALAWIRARAFSKYFSREVVFRALLTSNA